MGTSQRLLVIGLDGASFNVLDALIEKGYLPNVAKLIARGARAGLETTFPPITAVAWSTFMTGKNPGKHGIFEFVKRNQDRELAVNASFRRGLAVWDLLSHAGKRVIVHNFPCTYPPNSINDVMIADFMTPEGRRDFTHPKSLLADLEGRFGPYRLHLTQTYVKGNVQAVLDELDDELEYKAKVAEYLITTYPWDAFFQYFWGTDRIQHELWHVIDDAHPRHDAEESAAYREKVYAYFRRIDDVIGRLVSLSGKDASVWVVSDHGFGPVHKYCSLNVWLLQEGLLKLKKDALTRLKRAMFAVGVTPEAAFKMSRRLPLGRLRPSRGVSQKATPSKVLKTLFLSFDDVDWSRTLAFSKGNYGQLYVNLKGREPRGSVREEEYVAVCDLLVDRLQSIRDPKTGEKWVGQVFRRDEIYQGPCTPDAPDVAFLPRDMKHLPLGNADFTSNRFMVDAFGVSGCHRMHGVMIAAGPSIKEGVRDLSEARIADIAPTILYLMGMEVPEDMDGRLLREIVSDEFLMENPLRLASPEESGRASEGFEFSQEENQEVIERLKSLGYIGQ